jgi:hypothetical protein
MHSIIWIMLRLQMAQHSITDIAHFIEHV